MGASDTQNDEIQASKLYNCPKGLLCREVPKIGVCLSVRSSVRPFVRSSVRLFSEVQMATFALPKLCEKHYTNAGLRHVGLRCSRDGFYNGLGRVRGASCHFRDHETSIPIGDGALIFHIFTFSFSPLKFARNV